MKGIVFKELIEMVEEKFGDEMVDKIIENSELPSEGAYTSVGTYDHAEVLSLVTALSSATGAPAQDLVKAFGNHLVGVFKGAHGSFFEKPDAFSFLKSVDNYIHVEVKKLYPEAELPKFDIQEPEPGTLLMKYSSSRPFADLAEGLIEGVLEHFGETIDLSTTDTSNGAGTGRDFQLKKRA